MVQMVKKKTTDVENKLVVTGARGGGGEEREG